MQDVAPIIIVGSGLAGYTLAREIRKLNQDVPLTIITADDGRYYSKPQLSSAFTHHKTAAALGMMTAERMAQQLKAAIIHHTWVTAIDTVKQQVTAGDQVLSYSKLVLACGAEPIQLPFAGNAADKVMTVNNLQDYERFREALNEKQRVAIIGAGLVGCEFANDLVNGGYQVSVIALSETPLNLLLPAEAGQAVKTALADAGVHWYLGNSVKSIDEHAGQYRLTLSTDQQVDADVILSAIGLKPNKALAEAIGLSVSRGIAVNRLLETSATNVYALGDCAEVEGRLLFYVMPLALGAKALAATLLGQPAPVDYPPMPVIIKTPACPIVVQPPMLTTTGQWRCTQDGVNTQALFYDEQQRLQGFALTGRCVDAKPALIEQLPKSMFEAL